MPSPLEKAWRRATIAKRVTRLLRKTAMAAMLALTVVTLALTALTLINAREDTDVFTLTGTSMEPTHHEGGIVICDETATVADLDYGDIVCFVSDKNVNTCHRVDAILDDGTIKTRGDHNDAPDSTITDDDNLIGRVVAYLPGMAGLWRSTARILATTAVLNVLMLCLYALELQATARVDSLRPTMGAFLQNRERRRREESWSPTT